MHALVVTFDRLASRLIGCLGNEWVETPHFDRLATEGLVFENHFADSVGPGAGSAWWSGQHGLRPARLMAPTVGGLLRDAGVASRLVISESSTIPGWDAAGFDHVVRVAGEDGLDIDPASVSFARLAQAGCRILKEASPSKEPQLTWLHAAEPGLPPEGFATLYFEDFEERGLSIADLPREAWPGQMSIAAGSVSLVDHWLGELLSAVRQQLHQPTLVLIAGAQGRSWTDDFFEASAGRQMDTPARTLRDQETKSPLLMLIAGDERMVAAGQRCRRFVQTTDLLPTLLDWFKLPNADCILPGRSLLREMTSQEPVRTSIYFGDGDRLFGVRTADWNCLIRLAQSDQPIPATVSVGDEQWPEQVQLFAKPEDVWDVSDQSTQQPEVCEMLVRQLSAWRSADSGHSS